MQTYEIVNCEGLGPALPDRLFKVSHSLAFEPATPFKRRVRAGKD
nr:hypothetical protein [uncultured Desulfobacter sp.]